MPRRSSMPGDARVSYPHVVDQAYELLDVTTLKPHPRNANEGDVGAIHESIGDVGFYGALIVQKSTGLILAGEHRWRAAQQAGLTHIPGIVADVDDTTALRILVGDNRYPQLASWNEQALADLLTDLARTEQGLAATGYDGDDLDDLLASIEETTKPAGEGGNNSEADDVPEPPAEARSKPGDLWLLGPHRLLCGDSTDPAAVRRAVGDATVTLIHADPPYGMGKESDGVLNDNLYGPNLDEFQMRWWAAWKPALAANGSAYIWGNAPDLWRLWWAGGLGNDPDLLVRNEIVWDKGSAIGMRSAGEHSYPVGTERCLFIMRGQQFLGNQNKDDFWEGYEPLRAWLEAERDRVGWTNRDINGLTGTQMAGHWLTRSQFTPIPRNHYNTLQQAAAGRAFTRSYDELCDELFPTLRADGNEHRWNLAAELRKCRTFFDNTHDSMRDVWEFPRVVGDERHGHATPKPVSMVERAFRSSSQPGDTIGVPFGGSGPEFIAADHLGRVLVAIELEPSYVDVICRRYQEHTGTLPVLHATGEPHDFTA